MLRVGKIRPPKKRISYRALLIKLRLILFWSTFRNLLSLDKKCYQS